MEGGVDKEDEWFVNKIIQVKTSSDPDNEGINYVTKTTYERNNLPSVATREYAWLPWINYNQRSFKVVYFTNAIFCLLTAFLCWNLLFFLTISTYELSSHFPSSISSKSNYPFNKRPSRPWASFNLSLLFFNFSITLPFIDRKFSDNYLRPWLVHP